MALEALALPSNPVLLLAFVALAGIAAGLALQAMGRLGAALARRSATSFDDAFARRLPFPMAIVGGVIAAGATLHLVGDRLDPELADNVRRILLVVFVLAGAWGLLRILRLFLERLGLRKVSFQPAVRVTRRVVSVLVYAFAFLAILSEYGISITPLLTGLGLAALAVGLALQETLSNFFAGIWIQTEQPLSPGHYVRLEDQKVEGFVERVGWRTTRIRALAGNLIVIPNSKVAQSVVTDFTMPEPTLSVVMTFHLPFDVDPNRAMAILVEEAKEAAKATPGLLEDPAPFANATPGIGEYGIGYSLVIKVREFVDQWNAQTAVTTRVWHRFQREGIRLLYPTRVNLQADGSEFAPSPVVRARRAAKAPEGRDPREIEAQQAKQDIAAQTAADAAKGKVHAQVAAEAEKVAQGGAPTPETKPLGPALAADAKAEKPQTKDPGARGP